MPRPTYRGFRGEHLRALREEMGWTQEHLAVRVGVYPTMIGKWERGEVVPAPDRLQRLCTVLCVKPQEFAASTADAGIVDLRLWAGLTRAQAAEVTQIPRDRLRRIEHLSVRPEGEELSRLGDAYGVAPFEVLAAWQRDHDRAMVS